MPKLNQIIAIEKGTKTRVYGKLSEDHKALQKEELFGGHSKKYKPKDDDPTSPTGEQLPDDNRRVQARVDEILKATSQGLVELFAVSALRDWGNTEARADVLLGDKVLIPSCPVTFLLFLEKQLADMHTFVKKLPTLDPSEKWNYDPNQGLYATEPSSTARTKKIVRPLVLYPHTTEHPAQVKEITEDAFAGVWTTIKYSSALPVGVVNQMLQRVEDLQKAVKFAREKANEIEVTMKVEVGKAVFDYLFAPALGRSGERE